MSQGNDKLLIPLLAEADAIFTPIRGQFNICQAGQALDRQDDFRRYGLPLTFSSADPTERRREQRELDGLEKARVVICHRRGGNRRHWKLSDSTDWYLRYMAVWPQFPEMLTGMSAIREHTNSGHTNQGFVYGASRHNR